MIVCHAVPGLGSYQTVFQNIILITSPGYNNHIIIIIEQAVLLSPSNTIIEQSPS